MELEKKINEWSILPITGNIKINPVDHYLGKPLVILFFNLGCPGCKGRAIPFANWLNIEYKNKINVVGIHTNFEGVDFSDQQLIDCKSEFYINFEYFRDANFNTTFLDYQAGGTPHWIITDEKLNVIYSIFGSDTNNALVRINLKVQELLNNK